MSVFVFNLVELTVSEENLYNKHAYLRSRIYTLVHCCLFSLLLRVNIRSDCKYVNVGIQFSIINYWTYHVLMGLHYNHQRYQHKVQQQPTIVQYYLKLTLVFYPQLT